MAHPEHQYAESGRTVCSQAHIAEAMQIYIWTESGCSVRHNSEKQPVQRSAAAAPASEWQSFQKW
jgi:hypothetical protein